jgi:tetratricopeptide (TPR) repeat protein
MWNNVRNLNNQGVQCLKEQKINEARVCFEEALYACQSLLHSRDRRDDDAREESTTVINSEDIIEKDLIDQQENFVCWKALKIEKQSKEEEERPSERTLALYSVASMFNLALGFHLSGHLTSSQCFLRKAEKWYERVYALLAVHFEATIFLLVVVNNLGRVHSQLSNYKRAEEYTEYLLAILMCVADENKSKGIEHLEDYSVLCEGCFSNVMHLVLRDTRMASAA